MCLHHHFILLIFMLPSLRLSSNYFSTYTELYLKLPLQVFSCSGVHHSRISGPALVDKRPPIIENFTLAHQNQTQLPTSWRAVSENQTLYVRSSSLIFVIRLMPSHQKMKVCVFTPLFLNQFSLFHFQLLVKQIQQYLWPSILNWHKATLLSCKFRIPICRPSLLVVQCCSPLLVGQLSRLRALIFSNQPSMMWPRSRA